MLTFLSSENVAVARARRIIGPSGPNPQPRSRAIAATQEILEIVMAERNIITKRNIRPGEPGGNRRCENPAPAGP